MSLRNDRGGGVYIDVDLYIDVNNLMIMGNLIF